MKGQKNRRCCFARGPRIGSRVCAYHKLVRESYRCLIRPFLFSSGVGEVLCIRTPCATCLLAVVLTLVAAAATGVSLNEDYVSADDEEVVQEGRSTDGGSNKKEKYEVGVSSDPPVTEPVTPFHHQNGEKNVLTRKSLHIRRSFIFQRTERARNFGTCDSTDEANRSRNSTSRNVARLSQIISGGRWMNSRRTKRLWGVRRSGGRKVRAARHLPFKCVSLRMCLRLFWY